MFQDIWAADSGDIVSAIYNRGSIHPPGFPIYYLIGFIFRLIPFGTAAQKIGAMSSLFGVLTLISLFFITKNLAKQLKFKTSGLIDQLVPIVYLGFSYLFLIYSLVPEIYTLSIFIISLNSFFLLRFLNNRQERDHRLFWMTFLIGVLFHYVIMLSLLVYLFFQRHRFNQVINFFKKNKLLLFFYLVLALLPYFFYYLIWNENSLIYWERHNFLGLWRLLTRAQYGFFSTSLGSYQSFFSKFGNLQFYLNSLVNNFTVIGVGLAIIGIIVIIKSYWRQYLPLIFLWLLYGPLLIFYTDVSLYSDFSKGVLERYFLLSFIFMPIFIFVGYQGFFNVVRHLLTRFILKQALAKLIYRGIWLIVLIMIPILFSLKNILFISLLSQNTYFKQHANNYLSQLPKNSLLLMGRDMDLFPVQYYHSVLKVRPDIILVSLSHLYKPNYQRVLKHNYPDLYIPSLNSDKIGHQFIKLNLAKRRIFTNTYIGNPQFRLTGFGLLDEITLQSQNKPTGALPKLNLDFLKKSQSIYPIYFYKELQSFYAKHFYGLALKYKKQNRLTLSLKNAEIGYSINQGHHDLNVLYALSLSRAGQCDQAQTILLKDFSYQKISETALVLSKLMVSCYQNRQGYEYWDQQYRLLQ